MGSLQKNVASQNFAFSLVTASSGAASTTTSTGSLTAFWTKDGTQASAGGTFTYLGTGEWNYAPTQAETNATNIALYVTASSNIPFHGTVWTDNLPANFSILAIDGSGNVTATQASNIKKNQASSGFMLVMTTGNPATPTAGLTVSGQVSLDGAPFVSLTNSVAEIGSGAYKVNLAAADTNANHLLFMFSAASANTLFLELITTP